MNIETGTIVSIVLGIIVAIIGAYCKSLVKSLEDVKQNFEDYKKEDAETEKKQDEKILTLENKQINGLLRLHELELSIKEERKELATQIKALSDTIIVLTETIKHLEKEIKKS